MSAVSAAFDPYDPLMSSQGSHRGSETIDPGGPQIHQGKWDSRDGDRSGEGRMQDLGSKTP